MNILFISSSGEGISVAERLSEEGHLPTLHNTSKSNAGVGIVDTTTTTLPLKNRDDEPIKRNINTILKQTVPDLVVIDNTGHGKVADYIISENYSLIGGCRWADLAYKDRDYASQLMGMCGMRLLGNEVNGVVVDVGGWWNGFSIHAPHWVILDTRFMNGNAGSMIECAGATVKVIDRNSPLVKETVLKLEDLLKKTKYRGPIYVRALVTQTRICAVALKAGFLYDAIFSFIELYKGNLTRFLWSVATGLENFAEFRRMYAISVRLSIPPYPNSGSQTHNIIGGVNTHNLRHLWWNDVEKNGETYMSAASTGLLGAVTARGADITECRRRVYRTISNLSVADLQYRTDIGVKVNEAERQLRSWGHLY